MTKIERYIFLEVLKPLAAVLGILVGLFACFSSARYLAEAITETLGLALMLKLVFLKTVIALEVLVPVALYVSIIIGLGRMHRDQEIIAMRAAGIRGTRIIRAILWVAIPVGLIVGLLSVIGRPLAYADSYLLDARANAELNTDRFQAGRFYGNEDSGRVVYINKKNESSGQMSEIFHYIDKHDAKEIIVSTRATQQAAQDGLRNELHLFDGTIHRLMYGEEKDEVITFEKLVLYIDNAEEDIGYKRKAAATVDLIHSEEANDVAELQWRLSRPLATLLLALIAVPLSKSSPRQGRNEKIFTAAMIFALYYNISGLARTWVEQGVVGSFPGIWWLQVVLVVLVAIMLLPEFRTGRRVP
ncbi:MAG: LPS export ABC transporter permease LptF [Gammaproteobacteria bacterium]|nr:LPS export ABC transporter permease LptF [Gammaproteobacteria bacterium]